ncbi:DNA/RNA non-specific endonuclease [Casimicrobium huifangae]|uniref:DNA/RNA non-specific endonuclease n=1 Tax=Casimicrobium huifangae TaxID=2591109 RepID=UPI0012EC5620|nr:DNA/RNA non-specific endonuclease [Casimicrobium huifangae]
MMKVATEQHIDKLITESADERKRVRRLVASGRWRDAEPDADRSRAFAARGVKRSVVPAAGAEAIVGSTIDYQPVSFLSEGATVRRAVAYVEINTPVSHASGSGFLMGEDLFITNQHVIADAAAAHSAVLIFDREMDERGQPRATTTFRLDPDAFALFSPEDDLDYAVIAVGSRIAGSATLDEMGWCALSDTPDRHVIGMPVNIIQHPNGWPKTVALRNNTLTYRTDRALLYETDTEPGSSGSPVFSDGWDVVALHHYGSPFLSAADTPDAARTVVNEGVRISAIVRDLKARSSALPAAQAQRLMAALALADSQAAAAGGHQLGPPRPGRGESPPTENLPLPTAPHAANSASVRASTPSANPQGASAMNATNPDGSVTVTVPLEITVRLASGAVPSAAASVGAALAAAGAGPVRTLTRASEAVKVDADYDNRRGYDEAFIPGNVVALPVMAASLRREIAPLRGNEAGASSGLLRYEHFSLVLHKTRRMAIFTATNIDGATYLSVDRQSGQVGDSEGEKWFKDTRVSDAYTLNQDFYSGWSDYFDRGHLTRRTDPTWGTAAEAERANADTFHFANCSPQHFRFNQTAKFWQGAERFVLENGLLASESGKRICVIQGPIFNDTIDLWADDVQIPSSFFKVVVWRGAAGLKAVGMIVDQLALMSETRKALKPPAQLAGVDVSQWRVAIPVIEQRTGLDFGDAVRGADTIASSTQPNVGAERAVLMRDMADLLR